MDRVYTLLLQQKIDHTTCIVSYRIVSYRGYWYYSNVTETEKKDGDDHATCIVSYRGYWYYSNVTETEKKDGDDHINSEFQVIIILKSSFNISEKEKEKKMS